MVEMKCLTIRAYRLYNKLRNFYMANGGIFGRSKIHWKIWYKNI